MTAPPAERSIPSRANQACAGREAVRSSLTNRSALSAGMLHSHLRPTPQLLGAKSPEAQGDERVTGVLGLPTPYVWKDHRSLQPQSSDLRAGNEVPISSIFYR